MSTGTECDFDAAVKNVVMTFHIPELKHLLDYVGLSKYGRKHKLLSSALQYIKSSACNCVTYAKIVDIYSKRFPSQAARMRLLYPTFLTEDPAQKPSAPPSVPSNDPVRLRGSGPKFKSLPFYEHISEILPSTAVVQKSTRPVQETVLKYFRISHQQALKIRSGITRDPKLQPKYEFQVQLRFCALDHTCEQEDLLPHNLTVKVNRSLVTLPPYSVPSNMGLGPKRLNDPINITALCRLTSALPNHIEHMLEVKWFGENHKTNSIGQGFGVTINLVQQLNADDLLRKLTQAGITSPEVSRDIIVQKMTKDLDSDISTTSLKVSLICPLGKMRIKHPVRPLNCNHLQCFDANMYIRINEKKPSWICPVCNRSAPFDTLRLDGLFMEILRDTKSDEIEFMDNGDWYSTKKIADVLVIGTPTRSSTTIPIDLSKCPDDSSAKETVAFIDLTCDSSGDESPPAKTTTAPSQLDSKDPFDDFFAPLFEKSPRLRSQTKSHPLPSSSPYYRPLSPSLHQKTSRPSTPMYPTTNSNSPSYTSGLSPNRPTTPTYGCTTPLYRPSSPVYRPSSPVYRPTSPYYLPTSPMYSSNFLPHQPSSPNHPRSPPRTSAPSPAPQQIAVPDPPHRTPSLKQSSITTHFPRKPRKPSIEAGQLSATPLNVSGSSPAPVGSVIDPPAPSSLIPTMPAFPAPPLLPPGLDCLPLLPNPLSAPPLNPLLYSDWYAMTSRAIASQLPRSEPNPPFFDFPVRQRTNACDSDVEAID